MTRELFYSVLVVNSSPSFEEHIKPFLSPARFYPVRYVSSALLARRTSLFRSYDIVIINSPLEDENGVNLALDEAKNPLSAVLLFAPAAAYSDFDAKTRGSGIYLLKKPVSLSLMETALSFLASSSDRMKSIEEQRVKTEEKMEEIKLVSRAKLILIEDLKMSEEEAQRYIIKEAMDKCISKREEAAVIINTRRQF